MKKLLLLTALFTSLLIGFAACSDNEPEVELDADDWYNPFGGIGSHDRHLTNIYGELAYVKNKNAYQFLPDKSFMRVDSLGWLKDLKLRFPPTCTDSIKDIIDHIGAKVFLEAHVHWEPGTNVTTLSDFKIQKYQKTRNALCGTEMGPPPAWFWGPKSRATMDYNGHYENINIFIHIVRDTNGNGFDKSQVSSKIMQWLNYYYADAHIGFQLIGEDYINFLTSSMINYMKLDNNAIVNVLNKNNHSDAIDIYVLSSLNNTETYGTSRHSPTYSIIIHPACITDNDFRFTVAHEVGHCLYLYHTHHGTDGKEMQGFNGETAVPELVDGSNARDAGDYVVDTPADPNIWDQDKHTYKGGIYNKDANGMSYTPDPTNIMSYSFEPDAHFTQGQADRMHEAINNAETRLSLMTTRVISPTEEELGGQYVGNLHFSEQTKTLTFPVVADDEVVTWTISQRSSSGNATYEASPQVSTKTGKSITIQRSGVANYFEIYATTITPTGAERKSKVWKATAGVPSAAVGTLKWTGGDGTSGSFPGYSPTLTLNNYDTSLDLKYTDLANPTYRSGVKYRLYTSAGGMLESSYGDFCISEMDCSRGYVEVQAVDNCCGADGIRWRINCESRFDMFSLDMKDGQLMIGVKPAAAQSAIAEKDSAKRNLTIRSIKITTPEGRVLSGRTLDTPQRAMSLSTAGMAKGQYQIEITDVDGNVHKGHFGV